MAISQDPFLVPPAGHVECLRRLCLVVQPPQSLRPHALEALYHSEEPTGKLRAHLHLSGLSGIISEDALKSSVSSVRLRGQVLLYIDVTSHSFLLASSTWYVAQSSSRETMSSRRSSGRDSKPGTRFFFADCILLTAWQRYVWVAR